MEPKSLSPSAVSSFEGCEARYKAEYIDRVPDMQGSAAGLGSACHGALEDFVANGNHLDGSDFGVLEVWYSIHYYKYFSEPTRYDEGKAMLKNWFDRQNWNDRKVLSTELKETFDLKFTVNGQEVIIPFTYIWDRCDEIVSKDEIEVIDYKSFIMPVSNEEMRHKIQVRGYALAAQIKYPNAKRIWVTFDLLRYDRVGVSFSREDNIATWRYLQELAKRVWESDGTKETLNPECRWCVRKMACDELLRHTDGGGILAVQDFEGAVEMRARLDWAAGALKNAIAEIDGFILSEMEDRNILEYRTTDVEVKATMRNMRTVDRTDELIRLLPTEIVAKYGSIGVTDIDNIVKNENLDDETKSAIKGMITRRPGKVYLKTKSLTALDEES